MACKLQVTCILADIYTDSSDGIGQESTLPMVIVPLNLLNRADYELDVSQRGIIFRETFLKPSSTAESHDIVLHTEFQECMERMKHVMHILNQSPFGVEHNAARYAFSFRTAWPCNRPCYLLTG